MIIKCAAWHDIQGKCFTANACFTSAPDMRESCLTFGQTEKGMVILSVRSAAKEWVVVNQIVSKCQQWLH